MNHDAMQELLRRQPFEPFEIRLTNGEKYECQSRRNWGPVSRDKGARPARTDRGETGGQVAGYATGMGGIRERRD